MNSIINKAVTYIMDNLSEGITVNDVANHCRFSKYHFSRLFKESVGESPYSFIKRLKIEQSATMIIASPNLNLTHIGANYGYTSDNYSHVFKHHFGLSPRYFKMHSSNIYAMRPSTYYVNKDLISYYACQKIDYSIVEVASFHVSYKRYIASYKNFKEKWQEFMNNYCIYLGSNESLIDISYNHPLVTNENRCIFDIGITSIDPIPSLSYREMKGGLHAIFHFHGSNRDIFSFYQGVLNHQIPNADLTMRNAPIFSKYISVSEDSISFDLYIPVTR